MSRPKNRPRQSLNSRQQAPFSMFKKDWWQQWRSHFKKAKQVIWPLPKNRGEVKAYAKQIKLFIYSRDGALFGLELATLSFIALFIILLGLFTFFSQDLSSLGIFAPAQPGSVSYYDRSGKVLLWTDYSSVKRIPVKSNQISNYLKEATVAIEDKNFYHEGAFNTGSIVRAGVHDIFHFGGGLEGASTITEQVVKLNKGWSDPLSLPEKFEELALSVELAHKYSKDQILDAYLNIVPYGNVDYGAQAAAEDYFHEDASQLSLAQAAMLAAIPQAPTVYSPFSSPKFNAVATLNYFDPQDLLARQQYILKQMAAQRMISKVQAQAAIAVNVLSEVHPLQSKYQNIKAPYFVLATKQQLLTKFGSKLLRHGAWNVTTTLNLPLQQLADQKIQNNIPNIHAYGADEEALVAEQVSTGQVVALVGGTNFNNPKYGQVNYAQTNISPGSTIKPYVYSTLINNPANNAGAGSVLYDNQQSLPGYRCTNNNLPINGGNCLWDYDFRYPGAETLRYALAGSRNVPAVKAGLISGLSKVQKTASAMMGYSNAYKCFRPGVNVETASIKQQAPCYGSAAIGEGGYLRLDQTVNGFATLGRLGSEIPQAYFLNVTNASGKVVYRWQMPKKKLAIRPDTAYIVNNILSDAKASYLPGSCNSTICTPLARGGYKWQRYNGWDIAIKTGTTHDNISGLMMAWDTQYAVATWVGYHTVNKPLTAGGMEYMTEPLARGWMEGALSRLKMKAVNWTQPATIKNEPAYTITTHVGLGSIEPSPTSDIYPSWYKPKANQNRTIILDKVSGLLATTCTPADARETIANNNPAAFSIDKFFNGGNSFPSASDNIHRCNDTPPSISFSTPSSNVCSNSDNNNQGCQITATVNQGTYPLSSSKFPGNLTINIDGKIYQSFTVTSPHVFSFYYDPTANGYATLTGVITDSVLYQGTSTISLQTVYSAPPAVKPNQSTSPSATTPPGQKKTTSTSLPTTGGTP